MSLEKIGDRIIFLRNEKGMSQRELADLLHITKQAIYKYEKGIVTNIPFDKIETISKIFDVPPSYLLGCHNDIGDGIKLSHADREPSLERRAAYIEKNEDETKSAELGRTSPNLNTTDDSKMIKIKEIRKAKGLTAKELAERINVSASTLSLYENGRREADYATLLLIADVLGVSLDELFGKSVFQEFSPSCSLELSELEGSPMIKLGDIIRKYRKDNKLSLRDFAKLCGTSHSYIAMLEDGKNSKTGEPIAPAIVTLKKIATALNISLSDLMQSLDDISISPDASSEAKVTATGEQIKLLRLARGFTQKELSVLVNKSESAVRMWELGKSEPDIKTINLLAKIFGVTTDQIITNNQEVLSSSRNTPSFKISKLEASLLDLFRQVPEKHREMVYSMIRVALDNLT